MSNYGGDGGAIVEAASDGRVPVLLEAQWCDGLRDTGASGDQAAREWESRWGPEGRLAIQLSLD